MKTLQNLVELTSQLLSCPSITPDDAGCQNIIAGRLDALGFTTEFMKFNNVTNLWAKYGNSEPLIIFAGHTDVVPTGPLEDWKFPPFMPTLDDNALYGRGAVDMKGAIAAMIVATENFLKNHPSFSGSIGFLITSDEEAAAIDGTKKVIETLLNRGEKINYCIIGEPSSENQIGDQIRIGRRGSLHGKLTVHGLQGHVAHPHKAKNAIHQSLQSLYELTQVQWDEGDTFFPPTTFQITNIESGTGATNVIPGHLTALFNLRFGQSSVETLKQRIEQLLEQHKINFELTWNVGAYPYFSPQGNLIKVVQKAIHSAIGYDTRLSTGGGTSDGRFIVNTGAEIIELGLLHTLAHHVDECVPIDDLGLLTTCYEKILDLLLTS